MPWYLGQDFEGITRGNDIYFRPGVYDSTTPAGIAVLGHELVHVGQYRGGMNWLEYLWSTRHDYGAEGAQVVPLLTERLTTASDDATIRDIVLVFSEMSSQGAVRVAQDQKLMRLLTDSVARMKNPGWRSISEHELERIRSSA